jgi:shikimate dehydrogenase
MRIFGLVGYPLTHSFSVKYFTEKFARENIADCRYQNFSIENTELFPEIIKNTADLSGLNVTIPYKEKVIPYLNELDEPVKEIGAVNTVKIIRKDGKMILKGFNTDVYGFRESLQPLLKSHHKKALILGTGGASKAIKYVLTKLGISYISASIEELKENEIRYEQIDKKLIEESKLIIHCTPLGTYPNVNTFPTIPYNYISSDHILYDLVYNPEMTRFMSLGKEKGAAVINGLKMLHLQAEKAWEIWNK